MNLKVITMNNSEEWDRIVSSFTNYDIYYISEYVKAFNIHGDGIPLLFYFNNGKTRAINVVMKRDIGFHENFIDKILPNTYFDLSTVYGYGGFIVEGVDIEQLNEEYVDYCLNNNIVSEFVRFHPLIKNYELVQKMYDIEKLGVTVNIDLNSKEEIWSNIHSKNRNMIRKAIKSDLKVYWGRDSNLIDKFIEIYRNL